MSMPVVVTFRAKDPLLCLGRLAGRLFWQSIKHLRFTISDHVHYVSARGRKASTSGPSCDDEVILSRIISRMEYCADGAGIERLR